MLHLRRLFRIWKQMALPLATAGVFLALHGPAGAVPIDPFYEVTFTDFARRHRRSGIADRHPDKPHRHLGHQYYRHI